MRIEVDLTRCEGHGMCEEACPEVFKLNDDGELQVLTDVISDNTRRSVETAVRLCPVNALRQLED
jgi:ferredoxin